ncbi:hypothetical protein TIFTF001_033112 [Ficus carica]|uniref:Uncharacterized protein n=1 Tax=Ficus carica TaxID=3494 RepID=A0AA88E4P7_FICCA|nr:hypothetical protein TIFTF001_033112 [Ficus carica]
MRPRLVSALRGHGPCAEERGDQSLPVKEREDRDQSSRAEERTSKFMSSWQPRWREHGCGKGETSAEETGDGEQPAA